MKTIKIIFIMSLICLVFPQKAYAYLDPSTGSYVVQIIIASLIGGLFAIKHYFARIRGFIQSLASKKKSE
jgi:hypothetical protein